MNNFITISLKFLAYIAFLINFVTSMTYFSDRYSNEGIGFAYLGCAIASFIILWASSMIVKAANIYIEKNKNQEEE